MHSHTGDALKKMKGLAIGKIQTPLKGKFFHELKKANKEKNWKLKDRKILSRVHSNFLFVREDYNSALILPYYEQAGKYFTVNLLLLFLSCSFIRILKKLPGTIPCVLAFLRQ